MACSVPDLVSLVHSCYAGEDEQFDSDPVVCLVAAAVAEATYPDSELVVGSEELLVLVIDSYWPDSIKWGNP